LLLEAFRILVHSASPGVHRAGLKNGHLARQAAVDLGRGAAAQLTDRAWILECKLRRAQMTATQRQSSSVKLVLAVCESRAGPYIQRRDIQIIFNIDCDTWSYWRTLLGLIFVVDFERREAAGELLQIFIFLAQDLIVTEVVMHLNRSYHQRKWT
jgi:hypothetical protein